MSLGQCVITWLGPGAGEPSGHLTISIQLQRLRRVWCDMGRHNTVWCGLLGWFDMAKLCFFVASYGTREHITIIINMLEHITIGSADSKTITGTTRPAFLRFEFQC